MKTIKKQNYSNNHNNKGNINKSDTAKDSNISNGIDPQRRRKYIETLKNVSNLPLCLQSDMLWLADQYESNKINHYEGKYAALRDCKLSPPFNSESEILREMHARKVQGVIVRIGIPTRYVRI